MISSLGHHPFRERGSDMLFAFIHRRIADQDGEGRIELMLAAQVVLAAIAL